MKNLGKGVAVLSVATLALVGCSGNGSPETPAGNGGSSDEVIEWDYLQFLPLEHSVTKLALDFADDVAERTDGRLKINVIPAGELPYTPDEFTRQVGQGSVDMAVSLANFVTGDCIEVRLSLLPFLVPDWEAFDEIWPVIGDDLVENCFEAYGAELLYYRKWPTQFYFGPGTPVTSTADLNGKVVRQSNPEEALIMRSLGASTETIATVEVPGAIERGVVDVLGTTPGNIVGSNWDDFLDWAFELKAAGTTNAYIVVNPDSLAALPDDVRAGFDAAVAHAAETEGNRSYADDEAAVEQLTAGGMVFSTPSDAEVSALVELAVPIWEEWAAAQSDPAKAQAYIDTIRQTLGG